MDVQMPEMNGLDATAAIRAREPAGARRVPIVAMTAHAMASDRDQCLAAGMDAYVSKPVRAGDLFATLERVVLPVDGGEALPSPVPQRPEPASGVLESATLIENFGGSRELVGEVIGVFLADSEALVAATKTAAERQDAAALAGAAHALKGSIGLFSRGHPFELARRIELEAREGDLAGSIEHVAELEAAVARLGRELRALTETLGGVNQAAP
jgi:CheY-like chemotaxis protein